MTIKMPMRWKFFWILLAFSLTPLVVICIMSQRGTHRLGKTIADDTRRTLSDLMTRSLEDTAVSAAAFLLQSKHSLEFALHMLAGDAEERLASAPPAVPRLYLAGDFRDPATAPPDLQPRRDGALPSRIPDEPAAAERVSYAYPSFFVTGDADRERTAAEMACLSGLTPLLRYLTERFGGDLLRVHVTLAGGVHLAYPGHGDFPVDFNPRWRPWYVRALAAEDARQEIIWTLPLEDAATGQAIFTASRPIYRPDGSVAGVAALDVPIARVLADKQLRAVWSDRLHSFLVAADTRPDDGTPGLLVLAQRSYSRKEAAWSGLITPEWLTGEDAGTFARLIEALEAGRVGSLRMPHEGEPCIWGHAPVADGMHFVMVIPEEVVMTLPEVTGQRVIQYTRRQLVITGAAVAVVLIGLTVAALFGSRATTRSLLAISAGARRLAAGDFTTRLTLRTGDERDQVIDTINAMGPTLKEYVHLRKALDMAQEVQRSLLPQHLPRIAGFDIAGSSVYCERTGGDYFDIFQLDTETEHRLTVIVGDVSGHGVSSALLMATARALLRQRAALPGDPARIVADVNRQLTRDTDDTGQFMTVFYCEFDLRQRCIRWVRAGHDPALVLDARSGRCTELRGAGLALGVDPGARFEASEHPLTDGQIILIGTDGIWEMHDENGRMFGKQRLQRIVQAHAGRSAAEIQAAITNALDEFRGQCQVEDDITMVVIKVGAGEGAAADRVDRAEPA